MFVPFEHCQNSRFLIRACANDPSTGEACTVPDWVVVNQTAASVQVDQSKVVSVGVKILWLQAQLIVGLVQSSVSADHVATSSVSFEFTNSNAKLAAAESSLYIVVNQTKTFNVSFVDDEHDKVNMKTVEAAGLGVYIKPLSNSDFEVYLHCDDDAVKSATLVFGYTDVYHTDAAYWQQFSVDVAVFASEPPVFTAAVQNMTINTCYQTRFAYRLPSIYDADSSVFTVSFAEPTPDYIFAKAEANADTTNYFVYVD